MNTLQKRLRFWQDNLVDSGRKNSLLHFRAPYSSCLQVQAPDLASLFSRLVIDEKAWTIFQPPEMEVPALPTDEPDTGIEEDDEDRKIARQTAYTIDKCMAKRLANEVIVSPSTSAVKTFGKKAVLGTETGDGEIVPLAVTRRRSYKDHVGTVARSLYRQSESEFEDRGIRILYLACGMLQWQDGQDTFRNEWSQAPIVLVPIQMSRPSLSEPFRFELADEDVLLNPALELKLKHEFSLDLPALPEDWEEVSLDSYLDQVEIKVRKLNWRVAKDAWLGLFSFHKLVIYQDLQTNTDVAANHPIIQSLCGQGQLQSDSARLVDARDLDTLVPPEQSFCVVDADSSQLACIETVKRGSHLVLQGPPGTGKSQTITNIIAESLACGKSVLFVSEKMAALEVVFDRLSNAGLEQYCLELHSHKANKRKVVEHLKNTYLENITPGAGMTPEEFTNLQRRRETLNGYVEALHLERTPLKRSVYEVLAEVATLRGVPFVPPGDSSDIALTNEFIDQACNTARQLSQVWPVVAEGAQHPWHGCLVDSFTLESSNRIGAAVQKAVASIKQFMACDRELGESLGFSGSRRMADSERLIDIARILRQGPGVEEAWIDTPELDPLIAEVKKLNQVTNVWRSERTDILKRYNEEFFALPIELPQTLEESSAGLSEFLARPLTNFDQTFADGRTRIFTFISAARQHLHDWTRDASFIKSSLCVTASDNLSGLKHLMQIARFCFADYRPESTWFDYDVLRQVDESIRELQQLIELRANLRNKLLVNYDESLLELDVESMAQDVAANYISVWKLFKPGYYKLVSTIRGHRKDGRNPARLFEDLRSARELLRIERAIKQFEPKHREALGGWYRGVKTDFHGIEQAYTSARRILDLLGDKPPVELINNVSLGRHARQELRNAIERLQSSLVNYEQSTAQVKDILPLGRVPVSQLPIDDTLLADLGSWLGRLEPHARDYARCYDAINATQLAPASQPLAQVKVDLKKLVRIHTLNQQMEEESQRLHDCYGDRYAGLETDWTAMLQAITWTHKLRECTGDVIPSQINEIALKGGANAPSEAPVLAAKDRLVTSIAELSHFFEKNIGVEQQLESGNLDLSNKMMLGSANREFIAEFLRHQSYDKLAAKLQLMLDRMEHLRDWVDFKTVKRQFDSTGLKQLADALLECSLDKPEDLPKCVKRSLLSTWLSKTIASDTVLSQFRAQDHDAIIEEFRELDKRHTRMGYSRVIKEANKRRPQSVINQPGSEGALLLREANKSRKHLPLRKLFAQMPNLLLSIKPCFLMSPLSVSQYLDPKSVHFDLVVFDEASQIRSEDAVCSIYRGNQLVVCGDNKQLPPTSFFEQAQQADDDSFDGEDDAAYTTFDSILDECSSAGIPSNTLRWHYRSKHESLIAFSNKQFYGSKLVTFPSAQLQHEEFGVHLHHVPDGVYDRSGKQCNEREAEVVARLVMEHFQKNPKRTLGVITFSVAQMNTVRDAIEHLVRTEFRELEQYVRETTGDDKEERFFVKNLERIQGNERDVIIFSVGYGRDKYGRFSMNFGPLNKTGGERRLNVAVTRAREKTVIVSSIKSSDFDLKGTSAAGVSNFYHYLNYAEHGIKALDFDGAAKTGFPSGLQADIAAGLAELGYRVVSQVGFGGYRIDLGVVDPREPGRFLLGVECDGPGYQSSNTARDRDRIRHQVLEGLGWNIHRIWSPDWISRRDVELQRLHEALESARVSRKTDAEDPLAYALSPGAGSSYGLKPILVRTAETDLDEQIVRSVPYRSCKISIMVPTETELHAPIAKPALLSMLQEVISIEGPIHTELVTKRICAHWGLQRAGTRIASAIDAALSELIESGEFIRNGDFVVKGSLAGANTVVRHPDKTDELSMRKIEHIPLEELRECVRQIVECSMSLPVESLIPSVCRVFGYERPSPVTKMTVGEIINQLLADGFLIQRNGRLQVAEQSPFSRRREDSDAAGLSRRMSFDNAAFGPAESTPESVAPEPTALEPIAPGPLALDPLAPGPLALEPIAPGPLALDPLATPHLIASETTPPTEGLNHDSGVLNGASTELESANKFLARVAEIDAVTASPLVTDTESISTEDGAIDTLVSDGIMTDGIISTDSIWHE